MESTGERFIPEQMSGKIQADHWCRYHFVCTILNLHDCVVLDIASGTGYGSHLISTHAKKVYGIDISNEAIKYAQSFYHSSNLEFLEGSCTNIPLPNHSVDVLISFETIEHFDRHEDFFSEIIRVIRPKGILIMSSPNKRLYTDATGQRNPYHVKELYNSEFLALVSRHFSHIDYYGQSHLLSSVIYHIEGECTSLGKAMEYRDGKVVGKEPLYNIVIASNNSVSHLKAPATFFFEDTETINNLRQNSFLEGKEYVHNTPSWKLGHFLLGPIRLIRHIFSKHDTTP